MTDTPHRTQHHSSPLKERQDVLVGVEGRDWQPGRVTALSSEGCHLVTDAEMAAGVTVQIMFPGFAGRAATIATRDGEDADCLFAEPLPAAILDYIIRMSDSAARG